MRKILLLFVCIGVLLLVSFPDLVAYATLNIAQLNRIHSGANSTLPGSTTELFIEALKYRDSFHLRWQSAVALASGNDLQRAAEVIKPLLKQKPLPVSVLGDAITILVAAGKTDLALAEYAPSLTPLILQPSIAAELYARAQESNAPVKLTLAQRSILFAQALGLDQALPDYLAWYGNWEPDFNAALSSAKANHKNFWDNVNWMTKWPLTKSNKSGAPNRDDQLLLLSALSTMLHQDIGVEQLGPNLISNGGFEGWDSLTKQPYGWEYTYMSTGFPWNRAGYAVGVDTLDADHDKHALRVSNLFLEQDASKEPARAGLMHKPIDIAPLTPFVLAFSYCTFTEAENAARVYLTSDQAVFAPIEQALPQSAGEWRRITIISNNASLTTAQLTPILRSFGVGSVWFDDVSIHFLEKGVVTLGDKILYNEYSLPARCDR